MAEAQARSKRAVWVMAGVIGLLAGAVGVAALRSPEPKAHASADADHNEPPPPPAPVAPREPTPVELIATATTHSEAQRVSSPFFDDTVGSPSKGAMMLALFMGDHPRWDQVYNPDGPSLKLIKKDPSRVRGQSTCVRGQIVQIARETNKLFAGLLATQNFDYIHVYAAGDTGELVQGDRARFCGIFTGLYAFPNVSGGQTQSIQLVGMFDLPENR